MVIKKNTIKFLSWLIVLILLVNMYSYTMPDHYISLNARLLSSIMLFMALFPWVTFFNKKAIGVPFLQLWGAVYALYFAMKVHLVPYNDSALSEYFYKQLSMPEITYSLKIALLGLCFCYFGYFIITYMFFNSKPKLRQNYSSISFSGSPKKLFSVIFLVGVICTILYGITVLKHVPMAFSQIVGLSNVFALFSISYLTYLQFSNFLLKKQALSVYIFIIIPRLIFGLSHGASFHVIAPIIIIIIAYCTAKRDVLANIISLLGKLKTNIKLFLPIATLIAIFTFAFIFGQLAKGTAHRAREDKNIIEKLLQLPSTANVILEKADFHQLMHPINRVTYGTIVIGKVTTKVPEEISFQKGRTLYPLLFIPIPRVLWPSKPQQMPLNEFGKKIGMIAENNYSTSIRPTQIGDLYYNFGLPAVCFGMFMLGIIFAGTFNTLGKSTHDPIKLAIAIYIAFLLIDVGQDVYAHISGLFWHLLVLYVFVTILKKLEINSGKLPKMAYNYHY